MKVKTQRLKTQRLVRHIKRLFGFSEYVVNEGGNSISISWSAKRRYSCRSRIFPGVKFGMLVVRFRSPRYGVIDEEVNAPPSVDRLLQDLEQQAINELANIYADKKMSALADTIGPPKHQHHLLNRKTTLEEDEKRRAFIAEYIEERKTWQDGKQKVYENFHFLKCDEFRRMLDAYVEEEKLHHAEKETKKAELVESDAIIENNARSRAFQLFSVLSDLAKDKKQLDHNAGNTGINKQQQHPDLVSSYRAADIAESLKRYQENRKGVRVKGDSAGQKKAADSFTDTLYSISHAEKRLGLPKDYILKILDHLAEYPDVQSEIHRRAGIIEKSERYGDKYSSYFRVSGSASGAYDRISDTVDEKSTAFEKGMSATAIRSLLECCPEKLRNPDAAVAKLLNAIGFKDIGRQRVRSVRIS